MKVEQNGDKYEISDTMYMKDIDSWVSRKRLMPDFGVEDIITAMGRAKNIAIIDHLRANAVFLNAQIAVTKELWIKVSRDAAPYSIPPLVCGLATYVSDELPPDVAFAVTRIEGLKKNPEEIKEEARRELLSELKHMTVAEIVEMIEGEDYDEFLR